MFKKNIKEFILNNRNSLVDKIMDEQLHLMPELKANYNSAMIEKSKNDIFYNLNYLAQAVFINEKSIFTHYYNWLYSVLKERGIGIEVLNKHLLAIRNVLELELSKEEFSLIKDFLLEAEISLENPDIHYQSFIKEDDLLSKEAEQYLFYLLHLKKGKKH
jgi:hypothetical protein